MLSLYIQVKHPNQETKYNNYNTFFQSFLINYKLEPKFQNLKVYDA